MIPHVFPKYCIISRPLARGCFNSIQFLCFIAWAFPSCSFADDVLIKNQRVPMGHTPFLAAQIVEVFSSPCCTSAVLPGLASMSAALTLVRRLRALGRFGFWLLRSADVCPKDLCFKVPGHVPALCVAGRVSERKLSDYLQNVLPNIVTFKRPSHATI